MEALVKLSAQMAALPGNEVSFVLRPSNPPKKRGLSGRLLAKKKVPHPVLALADSIFESTAIIHRTGPNG